VTALCGLSIPGGNLIAFTLAGIYFTGVNTLTAYSTVIGDM